MTIYHVYALVAVFVVLFGGIMLTDTWTIGHNLDSPYRAAGSGEMSFAGLIGPKPKGAFAY